ncbi:MAG: hypothetical protein V5A43_08080 [Haloarculaceae archaeon]
MATNPVEANPVGRWLFGMAVIFAMLVGGATGAKLVGTVTIPYARVLGVFLGGLLVLLAFSAWYTRPYRSVTAGSEGA